MAAGKPKKSDNPKVFDVSRPGKTPANASSRPVITNRETVEDPDVSTKRPLMNPKQKVTVKSPGDSDASESPKPKTSAQVKDQNSSGAPEPSAAKSGEGKISIKSQPSNSEQSDTEKPSTPPKQPTQEQGSADATGGKQKEEEAESIGKAALDDSLGSNTQQPSQTQSAASAKNDKNEPLHMGMPQEYTSGKAVVSQHNKRRTLWLEILFILIILLLLAAIADLLLDAGIINPGLDIPHTDFFSN